MSRNLFRAPIQIIEDLSLVETVELPRSWRERVWSWPWQPWVKTKAVTRPSRALHLVGDAVVICHPAMRGEVERCLAEEES